MTIRNGLCLSNPHGGVQNPSITAQVSPGNGTSGSGMTVTAPAGLTNGNLILAAFTTTAATPGAAAGWTQLFSDSGGVAVNFTVFSKIASNEPASWTFGGTPAAPEWVCGVWTGTHPTTPINVSAEAHGIATSPTVTTTVGGCAIIAIAAADRVGVGTTTYPAACTIQVQNSAAGGGGPVAIGFDTTNQAAAGLTVSRAVSNTNGAPTFYIATIAVAHP